jgi:hypothetical protein
MTPAERYALLSKWIKPSSDDEVTQQDRAQRMVTDAIKDWPAFSGVSRRIYAKGSYANNTNVRRDSDVDIVVECREVFYYDYPPGQIAQPGIAHPYQGPWTPALWRKEVRAALIAKFGADTVDSTGKLAINVVAVLGSRPSIDIVPSFEYRYFFDAYRNSQAEGSCVYPTTGARIVNWPAQQLSNGRRKNDETGKRYKNYVRALKNAENVLCKAGTITDKPSYLMECLVWNVQNATLKSGSLDDGFRATLVELWTGLENEWYWNDWEEPNRLKWLFRGDKKWTLQDARDVVLETWRYLDY